MKSVWRKRAACSCTASTTCGCAWPTLRQPTPPVKSMNVLPSTSVSVAPRPSADDDREVDDERARRRRASFRSRISRERGPGISVFSSIARIVAMAPRYRAAAIAEPVTIARVVLSDAHDRRGCWRRAGSRSTRTTTSLLQPSSVDVRVDRLFRVFHNNRYPYIDVKVEQAELTELVEVDGDHAVHPPPGRVRARLDARARPAARRPRRAARGEELARPTRPAHPLDRRLHRSGLGRARDARALERRQRSRSRSTPG